MTHFLNLFLVHVFTVICFQQSLAQSKVQDQIVSADDSLVTINSILLIPAVDNVSGIYSKPATQQISDFFENDHRWVIHYPKEISEMNIRKIETEAELQKKLFSEFNSDALLTTRLQKGARGVEVISSLILKKDGRVLLTETSPTSTEFQTEKIVSIVLRTIQKLVDRLPYTGVVMSRTGQKVTLNVGSAQGATPQNTLSVLKILKVNRHPKSGVLLSTDKEIIGKISLFKTDQAMSFGDIQFEKSLNTVQPGDKVLLDTVVSYPSSNPLENRKDKDVSFGEKAAEWLPQDPPQYGKINASLGWGQYSQSASLSTAGAIEGSSSIVPHLQLGSELWITKEWQGLLSLRQSAFSVSNGLSGSSPSKINITTTKTQLGGAYSIYFNEEYYGPKLQLQGGLSSFLATPDASSPLAFTTMNFGGLFLGALFSTPLGDHSDYIVGGKMNYYLMPTLTENTSSGASSSVTIGDFSFLLTKMVRQNFNYQFELNIEQYGASFSGAGSRTDSATKITHSSTTLLAGVEYLF